MRKILLAVLFCLCGSNFVFAANANVSGNWEIIQHPSCYLHSDTMIYYNNGTIYSFSNDSVIEQFLFSCVGVTQNSDGTLSYAWNIEQNNEELHQVISVSINGRVSDDNSINFIYTHSIDSEFTNGSYIKDPTSLNFSGKVTGNTISGNAQGTYKENEKIVFDGGVMYQNHTGSIAGILVIEISNDIDTQIISGPEGSTNSKTATFTYTGISSNGIAGYYYQLDSNPKVYTTKTNMSFKNLTYGTHTFSVYAKDKKGNIDPTPAVRNFTIEKSPQPEPPLDATNGKPKNPQNIVGDPINSVTGNMYVIAPDLVMPGRGLNFEFVRTYNSQEETGGPLGFGWTHSYNVYLEMDNGFGDANFVKIKDEQAKGYLFADNQDGTFTAQRGEYSSLIKNKSGFLWTKKNGKQYIFNTSGKLTQIKDRNGNTIKLAYDAQGRLIKITDTVGRLVNLTYDTENRITKLIGPLNRNFSYTYDSNNNLIKVTDPCGNFVSYQYDNDNFMTRKIDAKGDSVYFTYDDDGYCVSSTGESNLNRTELVYDENDMKTTITDSKGSHTIHYYNEDGLIIKTVNPQNGETNSVWDSNLNLISHTDESGRETKMEYDVRGNLIKVTDPEGNITQLSYEPKFNLPVTSTDANGNVTAYTYNKWGNLTKITDPLNGNVSYKYIMYGLPIGLTNQLGKQTSFVYDRQGNLSRVSDPMKVTAYFTYDGVGNLIQIADVKKNITKFSYDLLNQLTKVIYPDGSMVTYAYDAVGNRTSVTDQNGFTSYCTYNQDHKITQVNDPLGEITGCTYDTEGNLTGVRDQNYNLTICDYDSLNRLILRTDALGSTTKYQYDSTGNLTELTDPKGQVTTCEYDSLDRLTEINYPDSTVSYAYDSLGRRITMTDTFGTTDYTYDKLGRLTEVNGPAANDTVSYTYDKAGNRLTLTDPEGKTTQYVYDASNRLISITDPQKKITSYTYDKLANLAGLIYPNGIKTTYAYDKLNRLIKLTNASANKPYTKLSEFIYAYDKAGRRIQAALLDGKITYSYNKRGELVQEQRISAADMNYTISYQYDPAGNRTEMIKNSETHTYTYNSLNQLVTEQIAGTGQITYSYDKNGNLIKKQQGGETANLTYDSRNRLIQFTSPGVSETYEYDGEGRRVSSESVSSTTNYFYDGFNVILERNAVGATAARYLRNPNAAGGIGGIINEQSASQYYHYDGLGSVVNLTNSSGAIAQSYNYDAFGNIVALTGSANNRNKFLTKQTDATGLVYFGARYYDPKIGRFITQDPTGMADGPNLYLYCSNNPVNWVDRYGLCKDSGTGKPGWWPSDRSWPPNTWDLYDPQLLEEISKNPEYIKYWDQVRQRIEKHQAEWQKALKDYPPWKYPQYWTWKPKDYGGFIPHTIWDMEPDQFAGPNAAGANENSGFWAPYTDSLSQELMTTSPEDFPGQTVPYDWSPNQEWQPPGK